MTNEWYQIFAISIGALLWSGGGTAINDKGHKWLRRFLLPFIWGVLCFLANIILWKSIIIWLGYTAVFHLGYGEKYPWWAKALVGCSYSLPLLVYGLSPWLFLCPITFTGLFAASNWKPTAKYFPWALCSALIGAFIGAGVSFKF